MSQREVRGGEGLVSARESLVCGGGVFFVWFFFAGAAGAAPAASVLQMRRRKLQTSATTFAPQRTILFVLSRSVQVRWKDFRQTLPPGV